MPELTLESWHNDQLANCSIMLYVMTVRYPSARKYRDVFEDIKTSVKKVMTKPNSIDQGKINITCFDDGMKENIRTLETGFGSGGAREEFTWMIRELTGETSNVVGSIPNVVNRDTEPSCSSQMAQKHPMEEGLLFSGNEGGERNPTEPNFDSTIYDYGNLPADWSMPTVGGESLAPQGVDYGDWGEAGKV
jgi:hypothetical protein